MSDIVIQLQLNVSTAMFSTETDDINRTSYLQRLSDARAVELLPAIFLFGCMMIWGIIGNSLVVYVFSQKFKTTTQTTLFVALACFDLITCSIAMPFEILDLRFFFNFTSAIACKFFRSMVTFPTLASNQILLLIAIDRFRKVCCPLKIQISPSMARKFIVVVVFVSVLLTIPAYLLYGLRSAITPIPGLIGSDCATSDAAKDTTYPLIYEYVLIFFFVSYVITFTILYTFIWRASRRLSFARNVFLREPSSSLISQQTSTMSTPKTPPITGRPKMVMIFKSDSIYKKASSGLDQSKSTCPNTSNMNIQRSQSIKTKATIIAFTVTFVFIASFIPHLVLAYLKNKNKDFDYSLRGSDLVAFNIFLRSFLVNSVINPLIYATMNPAFRRECWRLIRCMCCSRTSGPMTVQRTATL